MSTIGDPSGKDKARSVLPIEDINQNILGIKKTLEKMISFDYGKTGAIIVNNADWLDNIKYIDFLRDIGTHFSVNRMLGFDSVKIRLDREQNLSFLEFNYMLLQAYDFVELNKKYGCRFQMATRLEKAKATDNYKTILQIASENCNLEIVKFSVENLLDTSVQINSC